MRAHIAKGKGKGAWHREKEEENRQKISKALLQAVEGITKTELYRKTGLSRPTVDRHLASLEKMGNVKREKRRLFWLSNYEREKRVDEILEALYLWELQKQQSPKGRYETVDIGEDTVLRDRVTGKKVLTVHMKV